MFDSSSARRTVSAPLDIAVVSTVVFTVGFIQLIGPHAEFAGKICRPRFAPHPIRTPVLAGEKVSIEQSHKLSTGWCGLTEIMEGVGRASTKLSTDGEPELKISDVSELIYHVSCLAMVLRLDTANLLNGFAVA
jgi:hypothetical protein